MYIYNLVSRGHEQINLPMVFINITKMQLTIKGYIGLS